MTDLVAPIVVINTIGVVVWWWLQRAHTRLQRDLSRSHHPSARTSLDMLLVQCACRRPDIAGVHSDQWCDWDDRQVVPR